MITDYITYTFSGFLFDLDQSNDNIHMLESLVNCIPLPKKLYSMSRRAEPFELYFPGFRTFIDDRARYPDLRIRGEGRATTRARRRGIL